MMFSIRDCCKILDCSRSQVYKLLSDGSLESVHIGRSRKVTENQLVDYIKRLENEH
jgi:excisionase family DNA binding protein